MENVGTPWGGGEKMVESIFDYVGIYLFKEYIKLKDIMCTCINCVTDNSNI